jgi:predicted Zn-dependent peptidase
MQSQFVQHELPNGLRVVCEVMPNVRSAAAAFLARTGARHEAAHEHGVSHFLEHMCFKGTATRSWNDINVRFDELGAVYNAFTGKEHTVYYGWVPARHVSPQIELLADMMRPALPADEFQTERKVILEEIAMSDDNFDRIVWNLLHERIFAGQPLGHEILGEKETIENLSHDVLVDYHRRRYAPNNLCLLAAGAIEPEEVFAAAGRCSGAWPAEPDGVPLTPAAPALEPGAHHCPLPRFQQQSILILYPSVPQGHAAAESIEVFSALFGGSNSRCFWNIVQKGICTQAGVAWIAYEDCGLLAFYADGEPARAPEMHDALRGEIRRIVRDGIDPAEVQRVKNQRRTQLALEAESPRTRLMQLVDDIETHGRPRNAEQRLAAVERVNVRSIEQYLAQFPIDGDGLLLSCGQRAWP